jgi:hypothetical protein
MHTRSLSNTPLQWGEAAPDVRRNRFSGFETARKTAEAVGLSFFARTTPLKRGVTKI